MMEPEFEPTYHPGDDAFGDLARLVDGTLPAEHRAEVDARVAASPQLARMVELQAAAVDALQGTADTGAPARLRATVDRRRGAGRAAVRRPIGSRLLGAMAAAAAAAIVLATVLPAALSGGLSVSEAAALAQKPPTQAAPGRVPGTPQLIRAQVAHVPFPNYAAKFGWKPVGARHDDTSGRSTTTVYYEKGARTIGYTIVSGDALHPPSSAGSTTRGDVEYRTFRAGGRAVVTWERDGHTCVLSGRSVRPAELVTLADWRGKGAIPF
jgi:anti-sigma factor RsiW